MNFNIGDTSRYSINGALPVRISTSRALPDIPSTRHSQTQYECQHRGHSQIFYQRDIPRYSINGALPDISTSEHTQIFHQRSTLSYFNIWDTQLYFRYECICEVKEKEKKNNVVFVCMYAASVCLVRQ